MRVRLWLVLVSVCVVTIATEAAPPEPIVDHTGGVDLTVTTQVPVHVYSAVADLSPEEQLIALDIAGEVLSSASVGVAWTLCGPGACTAPSPALKVRLVELPDGSSFDTRALGHAVIDMQKRTGLLATVFVNRTRRLSGDLDIDHRILLGRTIAHELGHLLLATTTHGGTGLMREVWSRDELLGARRADWIFAPLDAAAIRERLARSRGRRPRNAS
jgi:hypothetical protein